MTQTAPCTIGVDIGGTKIRAGIVAGDGTVMRAVTHATDIAEGRRSILSSVDAALEDLLCNGANDAAAIGVSTAGVVDRATGRIVDATPNLPGWKGTALAEHLRGRWGLPVVVENDGKATLVAELSKRPEYRDGIAVLLTLGTGLGGAIAVDGRILDGANHVAGHFGMSRSVADDGTTVTLEHYVSGAGLVRLVPHDAGGRWPDSRTVLSGVRSGDRDAIVARDRWVEHIAGAIADLRWTIDPRWLILGGGVVDARDCWWAELERKLASTGTSVRPLPASCGSDAAMLGAAHIARSAAGNAA